MINFALQQAFARRHALKVISGLNNFDRSQVLSVVKAATAGGATFVDIAANADLIRAVKALTNLPVCVSAVEPELLVMAVAAGADLIEIGNFDSFYAQGRIFEAAEVLALTRQTRDLLPEITLSVTVPHGILGLIEKAAPTLAAAHAISHAVKVPVLCASGLSSVTAPMAIAAGAAGIGVGSAINQLDNEVAMVAAVRGLVESLQAQPVHIGN